MDCLLPHLKAAAPRNPVANERGKQNRKPATRLKKTIREGYHVLIGIGTARRVPWARARGGMKALSTNDVTRLLQSWQMGDEQALGQLMGLVYNELHRAAHRYMVNERPWHTLQTTALIHEVYLQLVDVRQLNFRDRLHFFALCAGLMRRIL